MLYKSSLVLEYLDRDRDLDRCRYYLMNVIVEVFDLIDVLGTQEDYGGDIDIPEKPLSELPPIALSRLILPPPEWSLETCGRVGII